MTRKETAEFYVMALNLGLIEVEEVIAWADNIIADEDSPKFTIIELSMSASKGMHEVIGALKQIPGEFDLQKVRKTILAKMVKKLSQETDYLPRVVGYLYNAVIDNEIQDKDLESEIYLLDDEFCNSKPGTKDYSNIARKTVELLTIYASKD